MSAEVKKEIELEIAHVLFLDIVGYSKLSVNEQHARVDELNGIRNEPRIMQIYTDYRSICLISNPRHPQCHRANSSPPAKILLRSPIQTQISNHE